MCNMHILILETKIKIAYREYIWAEITIVGRVIDRTHNDTTSTVTNPIKGFTEFRKKNPNTTLSERLLKKITDTEGGKNCSEYILLKCLCNTEVLIIWAIATRPSKQFPQFLRPFWRNTKFLIKTLPHDRVNDHIPHLRSKILWRGERDAHVDYEKGQTRIFLIIGYQKSCTQSYNKGWRQTCACDISVSSG